MSQPASKNKVQANADRYTVMLIIAFVALLIGCVLLYVEVASQGSDPTSAVPSARKAVSQPIMVAANDHDPLRPTS